MWNYIQVLNNAKIVTNVVGFREEEKVKCGLIEPLYKYSV